MNSENKVDKNGSRDSISEDVNSDSLQKEDTLDDIVKDIVIIDKKPRSVLASYIVTMGFIFGPLLLIIDLIFPKLFEWFNFNSTYFFGALTGLFIISSIISARN